MNTQSLSFKVTLTFLVVSFLSIGLVGIFARYITTSEFDRFLLDQSVNGFVSAAASYYETNHTWDNFYRFADHNPSVPSRRTPLLLFDADNRVIFSNDRYRPNEKIKDSDLLRRVPVEVDNEVVGYVGVIETPAPPRDPIQEDYIERTDQALLWSMFGAGILALIVGIWQTRWLLRPIRDLKTAIHSMHGGQLEQRVPVRTRDELGELAEAFNEMSQKLALATQLRRQMSADIAHELRTPLTVITGYIEGLQDGTLKPTSARFDTMYIEATQLKRLIDDLRTLTLADAGELKLQKQPIEPQHLLEQVATAFQPTAIKKQIDIEIEVEPDLPPVMIDRERIVQVLSNLVSNALRYTSYDGCISLGGRTHKDGVQLSVADNGSGISADQLPYIFERFYRADESRFQTGGESGLGLAIAKSIVNTHGGTIHADSTEGHGTTIYITLPTETS